MPGAVQRRQPPPQRAGSRKPGGPFKPVPRPTKQKECCDNPSYEVHEGTKICISCGTIKDDNQIVAEVTFGETSTGAATVQGGFVGETARHAKTLGAAASRRIGGQYQSREETEQNGRSELRQLCPQLHISQNVEEVAFNLWKLAAAQNFIQGRRTSEVAGVCLYAACRRDKHNTILLMDISEALQVNVFKLGDIYKELNKALYLEVHTHITPIVEIEPLLMKYASKLEFGTDTRQIVEDAARIIKRMKRDWMTTGRHPAGLCGACLILAARMNNHRRSVREVVYIVKVADMTIASRLAEFKKTRSSTMTVSDFRTKGLRLKHAHDPPSVNAAAERQRKLVDQKRKRDIRVEARKTIEIPDDVSSTASSRSSSLAPSEAQTSTSEQQQTAVEPAATGTKRRKTKGKQPVAQTATPDPSQNQSSQGQQSQDNPSQTQATQSAPRRDADGFAIPDIPLDPALRPNGTPREPSTQPDTAQGQTETAEEPPKKKRGRPKGSKAQTIALTDADFAAEHELEDDIETILQDPQCVSARNDTEREKLVARASALATSEVAAQRAATTTSSQIRTISDSTTIDPSEFDDDPEVQNALLSPAQVAVKEKIWVAHNEDWLRAQQAKHLKRALDEAEGRGPDQRVIKRRKRSKMGDGTVLTEGGTPVQSPADAAARMLDKRAPKGWSKSVDYAALNRILGGGKRTPSESEAGSSRASSAEREEGADATGSAAAAGVGAAAATDEARDGEEPRSRLPTPPDTQHAVVQDIAEAVEEAENRAERALQGDKQAEAGAGKGDDGERDRDDQAGANDNDDGDVEEENDSWARVGADDDADGDGDGDGEDEDDFEAAQEDITGNFDYEGEYGDDEEYE